MSQKPRAKMQELQAKVRKQNPEARSQAGRAVNHSRSGENVDQIKRRSNLNGDLISASDNRGSDKIFPVSSPRSQATNSQAIS
jgi:hypothetical protein